MDAFDETEVEAYEAANSVYIGYLKSIEAKWPEYQDFRRNLEVTVRPLVNQSREAYDAGRLHIQDILADGSFSPAAVFPLNMTSSIDNLQNALSKYPTNIRTRVLLVDFDTWSIDQRVMELLRLNLDVEPLFFWSSLCYSEEELPPRPEFLRIEFMTIKIRREFLTVSGVVSTVIVAFRDDLPFSVPPEHREGKIDVFLSTVNDPPSIGMPRKEWTVPQNLDMSKPSKILLDTFGSLLCVHQNASREEDLSQCLLILGKLNTACIRQALSCLKNYWALNGGFLENSYYWYECREGLNNYEDLRRAFSRYLKRHFYLFNNPAFRERFDELQDDQENVLASIRSFEAYIRDRLQVQTGSTSILDSKKTAEEGKGVKLVTVLAFLFIPINLAASIFGMNVQEINHTGTGVWVFVVTAFLMTGISVGSWQLLQVFRRSATHDYIRDPLSVRAKHALWLVIHGKTWWMIKSGVLLGLITSGRYGNPDPLERPFALQARIVNPNYDVESRRTQQDIHFRDLQPYIALEPQSVQSGSRPRRMQSDIVPRTRNQIVAINS